MKDSKQISKHITKNNALIFAVFLIGVFGFLISFRALSDLALKSGAVGAVFLSYIFAIMVDFFIVVIGAAWLWAKVNYQKFFGYMGLMILWTSISIVLNLYHAPPNMTAKFIAVLPPLMIFIACHVGWGIIEAEVTKQQKENTFKNFEQQRNQLKTTVDQLTQQRNQLKTTVDQLTQQRNQLKTTVDQLTAKEVKLANDVNQLKTDVNQLTQQRNQLEIEKTSLVDFFNSLTQSRSNSKKDRLKKLMVELTKQLNEEERNIKRDLNTIQEKLSLR